MALHGERRDSEVDEETIPSRDSEVDGESDEPGESTDGTEPGAALVDPGLDGPYHQPSLYPRCKKCYYGVDS